MWRRIWVGQAVPSCGRSLSRGAAAPGEGRAAAATWAREGTPAPSRPPAMGKPLSGWSLWGLGGEAWLGLERAEQPGLCPRPAREVLGLVQGLKAHGWEGRKRKDGKTQNPRAACKECGKPCPTVSGAECPLQPPGNLPGSKRLQSPSLAPGWGCQAPVTGATSKRPSVWALTLRRPGCWTPRACRGSERQSSLGPCLWDHGADPLMAPTPCADWPLMAANYPGKREADLDWKRLNSSNSRLPAGFLVLLPKQSRREGSTSTVTSASSSPLCVRVGTHAAPVKSRPDRNQSSAHSPLLGLPHFLL